MPTIKKVWTSSFVLFSGGFSIMLLALLTFLNNRFPSSKLVSYPFIVYGSNALIAFIFSKMLIPIMDLSVFGETSIRQTGYHFFLNIGLTSQGTSFIHLRFPRIIISRFTDFVQTQIFFKIVMSAASH
jgi:predicted acyltransferase